MKITNSNQALSQIALRALTIFALAAIPAAIINSPALAQPINKTPVTLDFSSADINSVAHTMATITGQNIIIDPRVKGTITLSSTIPVTPEHAMRMFAGQLRTQGFAVVDREGVLLVLPEAEAKLQSGQVYSAKASTKQAQSPKSGQIATHIFRLTHENAQNLVPVLRPLIGPNNTINVNAAANALVITDYTDNLARIAKIIASLDISNATNTEIIHLKHSIASDLAPLVSSLISSSSAGAATTVPARGAATAVTAQSYQTTLIPEPRSNSIIVRAANPTKLNQAKKLIEQLDIAPSKRADGTSGNIHIVHLKNADAAKLAVTLRAALAALPNANNQTSAGVSTNSTANTNSTTNTSDNLSSGPTINAEANNQPSTGGQIQADPATNSLIISAPEPIYRELRAVIDKLDQRRAQVYVESLIAEVRADKAADIGVQWQALGRNGQTMGILGTNFSTARGNGSGTSTNIVNFASQFMSQNTAGFPTNPVAPSTGMNLLLGTNALGILANFIQTTGAGNVLSTPTLLTLDNEEAKIIVGQNVPFVTGSYTNTGASSTSVNPFQTYERKDVGLTLRVRPQISEDGTIKMVIYQEVSNVVSGTATNSTGPVTNKRAIESSVLVDNGAIVVLGGLLEDQYSSTEDKVPVLGDVPVVGGLFKSKSNNYVKTNLMVFLRPTIITDSASAEQYSATRYDIMRASQNMHQIQNGQTNMMQMPEVQQIDLNNQGQLAPSQISPLIGNQGQNPWARPATAEEIKAMQMPREIPAAGEQNGIGTTTFKNSNIDRRLP